MNLRNVLRHAVGIGSICIMVVILLAAYILQVQGLPFLLVVVIAFVPGYFALSYIRGLRGWSGW